MFEQVVLTVYEIVWGPLMLLLLLGHWHLSNSGTEGDDH